MIFWALRPETLDLEISLIYILISIFRFFAKNVQNILQKNVAKNVAIKCCKKHWKNVANNVAEMLQKNIGKKNVAKFFCKKILQNFFAKMLQKVVAKIFCKQI